MLTARPLRRALYPKPADTVTRAPAASPLLRWDGRAPTTLIAEVEARLAVGMRFAVLSAAPPLGRLGDHTRLEWWWQSVYGRADSSCVGWAVLVDESGMPTPARAPFPVRACANQIEALGWLHAQLAIAGPWQAMAGRLQ